MNKILILIFFVFTHFKNIAQNIRQNDFNTLVWVQFFGTKKINTKTDFLLEYQWRRADGFKNWQQGLLRTAIQYKPNATVALAIGYANAETYPYGSFPIAANGTFPEHRIFEQAIIKQTINKFAITNRFRVEQRWLGAVKAGTSREIDKWNFLHRFRYLLKIQYPFGKKTYAWAGNEIFIGAGKNLGVNIFDQNRLHANFGCKINKTVTAEIGYINQTIQQGKMINNKIIMQRNNGITMATFVNF